MTCYTKPQPLHHQTPHPLGWGLGVRSDKESILFRWDDFLIPWWVASFSETIPLRCGAKNCIRGCRIAPPSKKEAGQPWRQVAREGKSVPTRARTEAKIEARMIWA